MSRVAAFAAALAVLIAFAAPAAADVAEGDRAQMQGLVDSQIDAFRRDDGAAAYGLASPNIHTIFPTADVFMQMVRQAYQPVYRPQNYTFGTLRDTVAGPMLRVFLTGPDGAGYIAEYAFQKQPDGTWKINGCTIIKDNSPTI